MKFRLSLFLLFVYVISSFYSNAQNGFGDILDTMELNGQLILLFGNKKWTFLDEYEKGRSYDSLFAQNWVTNEIYGYLDERKKPLKDIALNLYENNDTFVFPVDTFKFLRGFTGYHTGLDLKGNKGDTVVAVFSGKVRYAAYHHNGYGKLVVIRHYNGLETYYSHLSKILVSTDDYVSAGDVIGLIGATGRATTNHLHFEVRYHDRPFNPAKLVSHETRELLNDTLFVNSTLFGGKIHYASPDLEEGEAGGTVYHTIRKGDTLYEIAKKYHTTVNALCANNNITKKTVLKIGRKLVVR